MRSCRRAARRRCRRAGCRARSAHAVSAARLPHALSSTASVILRRATLGQGSPVGLAQHEHGELARPAHARDHDLAHRDAGAAREHQQIRPVLELLRARERDGRSGVLVPERAPHLGQQTRVGRVAADHVDRDRVAVGRLRRVPRLAPHLARCELQIVDRDAETFERLRDVLHERCRRGRPDREVNHGRDAPRERERCRSRRSAARPPRCTAASEANARSRKSTRRIGRNRYGPATSTIVTAVASHTTGYSGTRPLTVMCAAVRTFSVSTSSRNA